MDYTRRPRRSEPDARPVYPCIVGLLGMIDENGNNNRFAVRLKVEKGKLISEIENLVVRNIMACATPDFLRGRVHTEPHPLMMQIIPENRRSSRCDLIRIGDSYFTGLDTENHGGNVPFDPDCRRRENGMVMANNPESPEGSMQWMGCKAQFDTNFSVILDDTEVDVDPIFRQPFSFYIAEIFKIVDGRIRQIEAVLTTVPYGMESDW
ncbi:MAG TPA: hypothetical protein VLL97_13735 [Acidobacteriota bacterium]|nr:hypothetical protein [Acidobacteriota bacterium]